MAGHKTVVGFRVEPEFREEIKRVATRHHEGNESFLLREAARLYVDLRRTLGPRFEVALADLFAATVDEQAA